MTEERIVESLYQALLGRSPSGGEEVTKVEHLQRGGSVEDVIGWILSSPECCLWFYHNAIYDQLTAPDPLPPDVPRLYLWHVPKTGGTSLREMLRPHFAETEFCGALSLSELYRMSHYRLRTFRVIAGHFGPTLPQLLPEVPLVTVTLLREPVSMVMSHYVHWRDQGNPGDPLTALARAMTFEKWCRSPDTLGLWSNPQATSLCLQRIPPNRDQAQLAPEGSTVASPGNLSERAVATLDRIDIVATTGDLLAVYQTCLDRLGIEPFFDKSMRENVGAGLNEPISESTREWLLEHNTIDSDLFERAQQRSAQLVAPARPAARAWPTRIPQPSSMQFSMTLIPRWSVSSLLVLALVLTSAIAVTDALLPGVILIGLLIAGPCCALFTGRWLATAVAGAWAVALAAVVGIPDGIWATATYAAYVVGVAIATVTASFAAAIIERRQMLST